MDDKKPTAYILIGLPGIGKSTWVRKQLQLSDNLVCVSKDAIRTMIHCGEYKYVDERENLVRAINEGDVSRVLSLGYDLIIDECHVAKNHRMMVVDEILGEFGEAVDIVYVNFITDIDVDVPCCIRRRLKDTKGIPNPDNVWPQVIIGIAEAYEPVQDDELTQITSSHNAWDFDI